MAEKRKYNKKSEYWSKFDKKQSIEETLATNPLLQNSTYTPSLEGEAYFNSTSKAAYSRTGGGTTTTQGTQTFDLPPNLRRQSGRDKARKDSYSALVLGNWMVKTYFDIMNFKPKEVEVTFTPRFIK